MATPRVPPQTDVVVMGAGVAGICQARHLLLNLPDLRVVLVDPRPATRDDQVTPLGESLTEIAALFVTKELGLHDYMIERHLPKQGISFHWPKRYDTTATLDDYFHVEVNREGTISNFHVDWTTFERDVLAMTIALGAVYVQGAVVDLSLPPGDSANTVVIQLGAGDTHAIKATHVIDAAGQRFLIGGSELPSGAPPPGAAEIGSAWLQVREVDRTVLHNRRDPDTIATSRYHCTHRWFGHGHSVWQIPVAGRNTELLVGLTHHNEVIPATSIDSRDKLHRFLERNHQVLHRLVTSGEELCFAYRRHHVYQTQHPFSADNWYVIGLAAACPGSPQLGTTMIALAVESVTDLIRARRRGAEDVDRRRQLYNAFNASFGRYARVTLEERASQLGHASAMSWRIFFESMWWFGVHVPAYVGKWHLDPSFIRAYLKNAKTTVAPGSLFDHVYRTLDDVVAQHQNIGLLDVGRTDQLGRYGVLDHANDFRFYIKTEPRKSQVFSEWRRMAVYMAWWYARLQWRARGMRGLLSPRNARWLLGLVGMAGVAARRAFEHRLKTWGTPSNTASALNREASCSYRRHAMLQPWAAGSGQGRGAETPAIEVPSGSST